MELVFIFPHCLGGVASFNFNIINYSEELKKHYSRIIILKALEDNRPEFKDKFNANEVVKFTYSIKENLYYVKKRLNKLIGNNDGCIISDNKLSISAATEFNNPKKIFHLIHDFYYVKENILLGDMVDYAIAHSSFFKDCIYASAPELYKNRVLYIRYGVLVPKRKPIKYINTTLNIVFLGRLTEEKGVLLLKSIDDLLVNDKINVLWNIIGTGPLIGKLKDQWVKNTNVNFYSPLTTDEVYTILSTQDILLFPTSFEGTPVSILESIANGVVPIVTDLPGGIRDIVSNSIGFRVELNNVGDFAEKIRQLHFNRNTLESFQSNCFELAKNEYNINKNADNYIKAFTEKEFIKREFKNAILPSSFLDNKKYPNFLVKLIRKIKIQFFYNGK